MTYSYVKLFIKSFIYRGYNFSTIKSINKTAMIFQINVKTIKIKATFLELHCNKTRIQ